MVTEALSPWNPRAIGVGLHPKLRLRRWLVDGRGAPGYLWVEVEVRSYLLNLLLKGKQFAYIFLRVFDMCVVSTKIRLSIMLPWGDV